MRGLSGCWRGSWRLRTGRRYLGAGISIPLQPLQVSADIGRVLVAQVAILLESLVNDVFQLGRQVGVQPNRRCWSAVENRLENRGRAFSAEWQRPRRHFVQN